MTRTRLAGAALAAALALAGPAPAQVISLQFAQNGALVDAFTIPAVGQTTTVQVYLTDAGTTLRTEGVQAAGFTLTSSNPAVARVNLASDIAPNSAFQIPQTSVNSMAGTATLQLSSLSVGGVPVPAAPVPPDVLLLGTFTFTGVGLGSTLLSLSDNQPTATNIRTAGATGALDGRPGMYADVAALTVPVPEPASLALTGMAAAAGLAGYARWRLTVRPRPAARAA